ncbi:MAG TPA: hypothetical protein VFZ40_11215 [Pyrinomonadaceae bacterium]
MDTQIENKPVVVEPSIDALKVRYQELHTHFRTAFDLYLKGSTMLLAILGVTIGYLLQARLSAGYARVICIFVLLIIGLYYVCNILALRLYKSLVSSIEAASQALKVPHEVGNYRIFQTVIWAAMIGCFLVSLIYVYFFIAPPPVSK